MNKVLVIFIAIFALITSENLSRVSADDGNKGRGIPLSALAGGYASTSSGTYTVCLNPTSHLEESCITSGALVIAFTSLIAGNDTSDKNGNFCATYTQVLSNLPLGASPPQVVPFNVTAKTTNYDPASGTGDLPFTTYIGGKCNGAVFDSTGATVNSTGSVHFVASDNGKRIDGVFTSITDAVGGIGDFSATLLNLKQ